MNEPAPVGGERVDPFSTPEQGAVGPAASPTRASQSVSPPFILLGLVLPQSLLTALLGLWAVATVGWGDLAPVPERLRGLYCGSFANELMLSLLAGAVGAGVALLRWLSVRRRQLPPREPAPPAPTPRKLMRLTLLLWGKLMVLSSLQARETGPVGSVAFCSSPDAWAAFTKQHLRLAFGLGELAGHSLRLLLFVGGSSVLLLARRWPGDRRLRLGVLMSHLALLGVLGYALTMAR